MSTAFSDEKVVDIVSKGKWLIMGFFYHEKKLIGVPFSLLKCLDMICNTFVYYYVLKNLKIPL